jgi:hypothetical protein
MRYQLPLLVVKRIAQKELRQASRQWDIKEQPLFLYNKYYEIREILAVCGSQILEDDDESGDYTLNGRKEVTVSQMYGSDFKNADVLYWLFDTFWI